MKDNYQKFEIDMRMENDGFRLWKNGQNEAICVIETYKEKRSIFFSAVNLLPSNFLRTEADSAYHVMLLGEEDGQLIHQDFGTFYVNQKGEGSFFHKFFGPALSCYTHCLLVAVSGDGKEPTMIYRGETPFFVPTEPENLWKTCFDWCADQSPSKLFSDGMDETGARWYRIPEERTRPAELAACKPLIEKYHHYIVGVGGESYFVGIPGRFLRSEQPCKDEGVFLLWQPLRGGENFFEEPETMTERQQEEIFGYWIAQIDVDRGELKAL